LGDFGALTFFSILSSDDRLVVELRSSDGGVFVFLSSGVASLGELDFDFLSSGVKVLDFRSSESRGVLILFSSGEYFPSLGLFGLFSSGTVARVLDLRSSESLGVLTLFSSVPSLGVLGLFSSNPVMVLKSGLERDYNG